MKADIVITGSGVAAAALAWKLLRANPSASILVLEAGKRMKMRDFSIYQDYLVTGREPFRDYWDLDYPQRDQPGENENRGKTEVPLNGSRLTMYGGSTVHWGGWSFRLKPEDFHLRKNTGHGIDWPFDYAHLEPFYSEAEHYIGVSGDSEDPTVPRGRDFPFKAFPYTLEDQLALQALTELHYDFAHLPIARQGFTHTLSSHAPCQTTGKCKYCPFGARYVAANSLDDLNNLEVHENFTIHTEIVVESIEMESKKRATGVHCLDRRTGEKVFIEAGMVIVASGALESPKLLQRSVSAHWPYGIGNDEGLVGRHLITHPYFTFEADLKSNPVPLQPEMGFPTLVSRHFDSPAEQKVGKFILVNPPDYPKYGPEKKDLATLMQKGYDRDQIDHMIRHDVVIQWHGMVETFSEPFNTVKNGVGRNRAGLYQTAVDYTKDPGFDQRMAQIKDHVAEIFGKMGAGAPRPAQVSWRADHAACTTRMSEDPKEGVVDPNLKVHGTENVYVCSNASFASLGAVNPTLTLTALSLRLADHLLTELKWAKPTAAAGPLPLPGDLLIASLA